MSQMSIDSKLFVPTDGTIATKHISGIDVTEIVKAMKYLPQNSTLLDIGTGDGVILAAVNHSLNNETKEGKYFKHVLAFEPNSENYICHKKSGEKCPNCDTISHVIPTYHKVQDITKTVADQKLEDLSSLLCYPYCADESTDDFDVISTFKPKNITMMVGYHIDGCEYEKSRKKKKVTISGSAQLWNQFICPLIKEEKDGSFVSNVGKKNKLGYSLVYLKHISIANSFEHDHQIEDTLFFMILSAKLQ